MPTFNERKAGGVTESMAPIHGDKLQGVTSPPSPSLHSLCLHKGNEFHFIFQEKPITKTHDESDWISEWLQLRSRGRDEGGMANGISLRPIAVSMSSNGDTEHMSSSEDSSMPSFCW